MKNFNNLLIPVFFILAVFAVYAQTDSTQDQQFEQMERMMARMQNATGIAERREIMQEHMQMMREMMRDMTCVTAEDEDEDSECPEHRMIREMLNHQQMMMEMLEQDEDVDQDN